MSDYNFKGQINLCKSVPFVVNNGIARFNIHSKNLLPFDKRHIILEGTIESGDRVYLQIDRFYECGLDYFVYEDIESISAPHIEAIVEVCIVLESHSIDDVDAIGFYSLDIPKITNFDVRGAINDENLSSENVNKILGLYKKDNNTYTVSVGFTEQRPFYSGQMIVLSADDKLTINQIKELYWLMKKALIFIYQKRLIPLEDVYLRCNQKNIGKLYIEKNESSRYLSFTVKCLPVLSSKDKFSNLLQALADDKIYLRHVPIFKDDEMLVTPGRFLMGLVGLESTLDIIGTHITHGKKHLNAIESVKDTISGLIKNTSGKEKDIYKRIADHVVAAEDLAGRIRVSLEENSEYICNFFALGMLGNSLPEIAKGLAITRNALAHGSLGVDLLPNSSYQMHFIMLYILYLQLEYIGYSKKEASEIVPCILFEH